jgi:hypothetical protein
MIKEQELDLIDRASFIKHLFNDIRAEQGTDNVGFDTNITLYELITKIYSFPAVNHAEAEWIPDGKNWKCSWCTMGVLRDDSGALVRTRYCPRCGRLMRR